MDKVKEELNQKQKTSTPSFLIKTYDILENSQYSEFISWTEDGQAFVVKNVNDLAEKVLPNHFKHNNYASFVRQLNMYDFHKMKNESGENEFRHKYFQRGSKQLLCEIKRKQGEPAEQQENQNSSQNSNNSVEVDMGKLKNDYQFFLNEMLGIKGKQHELQKALILIMTQNDHLINENKLLWQEIKRIRETDERKIDTLSYLLATFITNMNTQQQNQQQPLQVPSQNQQQDNKTPDLGNFMSMMKYQDQGKEKMMPQPEQQNSFLEKMMKTQQQQDQNLQLIKQDISQYDNSYLKKNCAPFSQQQQRLPQPQPQMPQIPQLEPQYMMQQNSQALIQQLMSLQQQQKQQPTQQQQQQQQQQQPQSQQQLQQQQFQQQLNQSSQQQQFQQQPFQGYFKGNDNFRFQYM